MRASPVPKLIDHGSLREEVGVRPRRRCSAGGRCANVVVPRIENGSGTWYRTLATRWTCWPSISAARRGRRPRRGAWRCRRGATREPGDRVERELVDDRAADQRSLLGLVQAGRRPSRHRADDALGQRDPVDWLAASGRSTSRWRRARCRRAGPPTSRGRWRRDSSVPSTALVTVPLSRPSSSRSSAATSGPVALRLRADRAQGAEADREVADPRRVALERRRAPAPCPPPNTSPFIGAASRASPATASWYVARDGLKMPRYDCAVAWSVPGAPRTIATSWTMTSEPRSSDADAERADREHGDERRAP